jgi:hypothetical protein
MQQAIANPNIEDPIKTSIPKIRIPLAKPLLM